MQLAKLTEPRIETYTRDELVTEVALTYVFATV